MNWDLKSRLDGTALMAVSLGVVFMITSGPVSAADQTHDEIQVYNAEIADVGQWTSRCTLASVCLSAADAEGRSFVAPLV